MKATAIAVFDGARDGDLYPTRFIPGDLVEGSLAEIAVREKWAEEINSDARETASSGRKTSGAGKPGR